MSLRSLAAPGPCCALLLAACGGNNGDPSAAAGPPRYSVVQEQPAKALARQDPTLAPNGANIPGCQPTAAHPYPVVLVTGTFIPMEQDFAALAPVLANAGYCVYALNYGYYALTGNYATGPMDNSALQLSAFIARVLAETGAAKVELIGHSQGGTLAEDYAKNLNGAARIDALVGLAPTTHGTTLGGITQLAQTAPPLNIPIGLYCPACVDQEPQSAFIEQLAAYPIAQPGVRYTVIESRDDTVVTPLGSAFIDEPGVNDLYIQDLCPDDSAGHDDLLYDNAVIRTVLNALDPAQAGAPDCGQAYPAPVQ
jgi:triacylglycerol esterase/lipase EstA (alpha/beta hydrolase family)